MASSLGIGGFVTRAALTMALVFGTYNPTEYSYISWAFSEGHEFGPVTALAGIALLIAWIVFVRNTFLAIGWVGVMLGTALLGCFVWLFVDLGWLSLDSPTTITWVALTVLAMILAIGLSWAHIRRRLSGQLSVDDVED